MKLLYESKKWIEDVEAAVNSLPFLKELENKKIMITGAAGLVCSSVVDILIRYNETHENTIGIVVAGRWLEEMTNRFGKYCDKDYFEFVVYDASKDDNKFTVPVDLIIHGASNAFPAAIINEPVETMLSNFTGLLQLLNFARDCGSKRVLYISSSEVYGKKESNEPYREGEYGFVDLLNPRSSYPVGKRAAETLCACYSQEYGVESVIVRPGHIYGPTASPNDNRIASAFGYAAARGETLEMKSAGTQLRSYCHTLDCASAMLTVLVKGENNTAYNISNPNSIITIKEMAELMAKAGGVELNQSEASEEEKKSFNFMDNSSLDSTNLEGLGWKGMFSAENGITSTVETLRDIL